MFGKTSQKEAAILTLKPFMNFDHLYRWYPISINTSRYLDSCWSELDCWIISDEWNEWWGEKIIKIGNFLYNYSFIFFAFLSHYQVIERCLTFTVCCCCVFLWILLVFTEVTDDKCNNFISLLFHSLFLILFHYLYQSPVIYVFLFLLFTIYNDH